MSDCTCKYCRAERRLREITELALERDELRERVAKLVSALEWIAETPDAWIEHGTPDGATAYEWRYSKHFLDIAKEALAKTKETQP